MWFKIAFGLAFIFAATVATRTARRARQRHGGALNQLPHEVRGLIAARSALGLVFYATLGAWLFFPGALSWTYVPIPTPLRWLAVACLAPVLSLFASSYRVLGANYRGGVGLYTDHQLVTTGPYRWLRHPIYAAFIVIML